MTRLDVLASGSTGNCYLLRHNDEILVIEQGIPFIEVKKALDYNIMPIAGAVVSHAHLDHHKYTHEYELAGIPVFEPFKTDKRKTVFGAFTVQSFEVVHDVPCFGFYIKVGDQKILFVTDTEYVGYNFEKLAVNHIICECNYQAKYIEADDLKATRQYQTHMELETCKDFLRANQTPELKNVILCHLSKTAANPTEMVAEVKDVVGGAVDVLVAERGLSVDLERVF